MFNSKKLFLALLLLSTLQTTCPSGWFFTTPAPAPAPIPVPAPVATPEPSFFSWLFFAPVPAPAPIPVPAPVVIPTAWESARTLVTDNPKTTLSIIVLGAATVYGTKRLRELKNENTGLIVNLHGLNVMLADEKQAKELADQAYSDMSTILGEVTKERDLLKTELACLTAQKEATNSDTFDA